MDKLDIFLSSQSDYPSRRMLIYLLIDTSGSMNGEPIAAVQQGIEFLFNEWRRVPELFELLYISVITFGSDATVVLPLTPISDIKRVSLHCNGSTNLTEGLKTLDMELERDLRLTNEMRKGDYRPLVVLLTDGEPDDIDSAIEVANLIKNKNRIGSFIGFGCGESINVSVLQRIVKNVMTFPDMTKENIGNVFRWIASSVSIAVKSEIYRFASDNSIKVAVVGDEDPQNRRLLLLLKKLARPEDVFRHIDIQSFSEFPLKYPNHPILIFIDLFSLDVKETISIIGEIRTKYPRIVFCLYIDKEVEKIRWNELPPEWQKRLEHYFKLYRVSDDTEFEPIVRQTFYKLKTEAKYNFGSIPVPLPDKATFSPIQPENTKEEKQIFISYSRRDWDQIVSPLADNLTLKGFKVWVDQHLLVGGDDWMDSIGEALDKCKALILVMSPDAIASKYVKMEYRYFFNQDKPIIPIMFRATDKLPPEISTIQYLNFTEGLTEKSLAQLNQVLQHRVGKP